tara:strand:- start:421 stop:1581 length:1161 start_codon:yes stop_codon:yes gene_type:complete
MKHLIPALLAVLFLSLTIAGNASAATESDTSDCTLTISNYCIAIDFVKTGMYIGGIVLLAGIVFGVRNMKSNEGSGLSGSSGGQKIGTGFMVIGVLQGLLLIAVSLFMISVAGYILEDRLAYIDNALEICERDGCSQENMDAYQAVKDRIKEAFDTWKILLGACAFFGVVHLIISIVAKRTAGFRLVFFFSLFMVAALPLGSAYTTEATDGEIWAEEYRIGKEVDMRYTDGSPVTLQEGLILERMFDYLIGVFNSVIFVIGSVIALINMSRGETLPERKSYAGVDQWSKTSDSDSEGIKELDLDNLLSDGKETSESDMPSVTASPVKGDEKPNEEEVQSFQAKEEDSGEMTTIKCPTCASKMEVRILGKSQNVTCNACGTSGEIDI